MGLISISKAAKNLPNTRINIRDPNVVAINRHYSEGKVEYIEFIFSWVIAAKLGMHLKDPLEFFWDAMNKTGSLLKSTVTDGRPIQRYGQNKYTVRFRFVDGYNMPYPEGKTQLLDVTTENGKMNFYYNGRIK